MYNTSSKASNSLPLPSLILSEKVNTKLAPSITFLRYTVRYSATFITTSCPLSIPLDLMRFSIKSHPFTFFLNSYVHFRIYAMVMFKKNFIDMYKS